MVGTVFKTIKSEMIWRTIWQSRSQAVSQLTTCDRAMIENELML
jgi:hypothetical protein